MSFADIINARDLEREYSRGYGRRATRARFNAGYLVFGIGIAFLACALVSGAPPAATARPAYDFNALPTLEFHPCR